MPNNPQTKLRLSLLNSGVAGLDEVLGGGFPRHSLYLIQGLAGSGKTTMACQIGFAHAVKGEKVLILTLIAETHGKMLNHLSNFSFFDEELIGKNILMFGGYNELVKGGLDGLLQLITGMLAKHNADILIIDGFRSVRDSSPSTIGLSEFMLSLNSLVASMECTTFLLSPTEGNVADSENTLVDGLIELSQHEKGMQLIREIKVFKIRGGKHLLGRHVFEVGEDGIVVYPRLEAISTANRTEDSASNALVGFGIPGWNNITKGGVNKGSTTELLGNPGVGKTLMGLHFIYEGLQRGEPCLIVGFYESPMRLLAKARSINIDLERFIDNGQLQIIWNPPLELSVDALAHQILENIGARKVSRLFVDGMDGLLDIIMHVGRARSFLTAFVNELRSRNVTSFFTRELAYLGNKLPENFDSSPSSILYENIMLLQYVEISGINYRQIAVLKLRQNGYDSANHIMLISDNGISIGRSVSTEKLTQEIIKNNALNNEPQ
ncbi:MAG: ATPase domain-containing protein [Cellvibrio sp.]|uniref:ATPase domain-containing protein n=1 Tax=Cellvibrio sp. TaxID=1965322 RepID=UPI0031B480D7